MHAAHHAGRAGGLAAGWVYQVLGSQPLQRPGQLRNGNHAGLRKGGEGGRRAEHLGDPAKWAGQGERCGGRVGVRMGMHSERGSS